MKIHTFLSDTFTKTHTFLKIVSKYTSFHTVSPPPKKYENSNDKGVCICDTNRSNDTNPEAQIRQRRYTIFNIPYTTVESVE